MTPPLSMATNALSSGGVRPEHVVKAGSQLDVTHALQASLSPPMHFDQHLDAVQPARSPKHDEHASEYPSALSMHDFTHEERPRHLWPQVDMSVSKLALPLEFHAVWSAESLHAWPRC